MQQLKQCVSQMMIKEPTSPLVIKLHCPLGNANLAPHFILEELGVDFQLCLVERAFTSEGIDAPLV